MDRKMTPTDQVRIRSLRLANRRFRPNVIRVMTLEISDFTAEAYRHTL